MLFKFIVIISISSVFTKIPESLEIIERYGYKGEAHEVQTADGYLLTIHRIVPNNIQTVKKPPIFLMHGLIASSREYLQLKNESLAFVLSNNGYDVYMGNNRGNQYSSHIKYQRNCSEFWDYSWHEIGYYDLPAMIDYVLNFTNSEKLFYYGFSQGATAGLVLLSTRPEYNQKILQVHLAGPVVFMSNIPNIMLRNNGRMLIEKFSQGNVVNFTDAIEIIRPIMKKSCDRNKPLRLLACIIATYIFAGGNVYKVEAEYEATGNYLYTITPIASKRQLIHFKQLTETKHFQHYDYESKNIEIYGSEKPPKYDLDKITAPVYIYCAGQDAISSKKDVERLRDELPNVVFFHVLKNYNHIDFEHSRGSVDEIYLKMVKFMEAYDSEKIVEETPSGGLFSWICGLFNIFG